MKIKIKFTIKAILCNVDKTILDKLDIGNGYNLIIDNFKNGELYNMLDCTVFGIRRKYELAKINKNLDVILLSKEINKEYSCKIIEDHGIYINGKRLDDFIYDYECDEMHYVDIKLRLMRLYTDNYIKIKELYIKTNCSVDGRDFSYVSIIPFPDYIRDDSPKMILDTKKAKKLNKFMKEFDLDFSKLKYSKDLLTHAAYLLDQSYYANTDALKFTTCIIGLESLLLGDNISISYKLKRNLAILLSKNRREYYYYGDLIKDLYNKRSRFVHDGEVEPIQTEDIEASRDLLRKVIFKIVELNMKKSDLLKYLDEKGIE